MVRIAILAVAIGLLALTSCRTPQHAPENASQAAAPRDVPSAHAEPVRPEARSALAQPDQSVSWRGRQAQLGFVHSHQIAIVMLPGMESRPEE